MTSADVVRELRAARPVASDELRERVRAIAASDRGPAPSPPGRRGLRLPSFRRAALVAVPAAVAIALAAAGAVGVWQSGTGGQEAGTPTGRLADSSPSQEKAATTESAGAADAGQAGTGEGFRSAAPTSPPSAPSGALAPADRAQRQTATIALQVDDAETVSETAQRALTTTRSLGGYAVDVSVATDRRGYATMTLRIPSARVQDAVVRLTSLGEVLSQQVVIDDLQEALDALARQQEALRAELVRVRARLASGSLGAEERQRLESRRSTLRAELASAGSQAAATRKEAALATVALTIQTPPDAGAAPVPSRFDRALDAALGVLAWEGLALLVGLLVVSPLLVAGGVGWLAHRLARRRSVDRLLGAA